MAEPSTLAWQSRFMPPDVETLNPKKTSTAQPQSFREVCPLDPKPLRPSSFQSYAAKVARRAIAIPVVVMLWLPMGLSP